MISSNSRTQTKLPVHPINQVLKVYIPKSCFLKLKPIHCFHHQDPRNRIPTRTHLPNPIVGSPDQSFNNKNNQKLVDDDKIESFDMGSKEMMMMILCGFRYWIQGFRCFQWLALNIHMTHNLNCDPSKLQLVQSTGGLPMVAKPLHGTLSDALYIGGTHRISYISLGD